MNLALVKLPFVFVSMVGFQKTTTPPNPPPSPDEIATSTRLEVVVRHRVGNLAVRVCNVFLFSLLVYLFCAGNFLARVVCRNCRDIGIPNPRIGVQPENLTIAGPQWICRRYPTDYIISLWRFPDVYWLIYPLVVLSSSWQDVHLWDEHSQRSSARQNRTIQHSEAPSLYRCPVNPGWYYLLACQSCMFPFAPSQNDSSRPSDTLVL